MSDILLHAEAGVMTLTLNRLERKNSITAAMYAALADGLAQAREDASVRVVLVQGTRRCSPRATTSATS